MTRMTKFEDILAHCLDLLEQGFSIEEILAQYPQQVAELRPLLQLSSILQKRRLEPSIGAQQASLARFLDTAVSLRQQNRSPGGWPWRTFFSGFFAASLTALLLFFVVVNTAQNALPGDTLYGAKLYGEQMQMEWAGDVDSRLQLQETLTKRRREEVRALLDSRREEQVRFTGEIEGIAGNVWQIEGLTVEVSPEMADAAQVGMVVTIIGHTAVSGVVQADEILLLSPPPTPSPTPEPSPTLLPTATPSPSATPEPTTVPTLTPEPSPTATVIPVVQPTRDDDSDDDSDDPDDSDDSDDDDSDDSDDPDDSDDDDSDDSDDPDDSDDDDSDDSDDPDDTDDNDSDDSDDSDNSDDNDSDDSDDSDDDDD